MMINSTTILFYMNMLLGVMLSLSSNNWIMMWVGMEISLMSFIPLMVSNLIISSECSMKYFIIQSMSSSIFILGVIFMLMGVNMNYEMIITLSMAMKMGVAPFHTWMLSIIEGLNYSVMFNLFTIMKIVPMMIIMNMNLNLNLIIIFTLLIGSIMGLNQNSIRSMLTYSSIFNMGFMMYAMKNMSLWLLYFCLYSINLFMLTLVLSMNNVNYLNQLIINKFELKLKLSLWILMLSSGGMPPMIGFLGKLIVIELSINFNDWLITVSMIFTSLLTMFYYNRLCFVSMSISSLMTKWKIMSFSWLNMNIAVINLMVMPMLILSKYLT
uniref:NADH-ubiquinone oxidoreductase chain 2 n=1 Tax=Sahlbergotettix salicicola TaxID=2937677 RepID=A0A9E9JLY9_9HEMI|nr:NADH dehydrogenase subunit 2 [Sahlbergotettix salicicola]WAP91671.1 NADH dehydrogenase subunit 2 [Sahlbergotettix salicicola]